MLLLATQASRQWLVSLICSDPSQASGGCHRSLQWLHLLEQAGWRLEQVAAPSPPRSRWITLAGGLQAALRDGPLCPFGIDSLRSQGQNACRVAELHQRYPRLTGVILEGTGFGSLASVAEWRRRGVRTMLLPANIEALAPNFGSWTHRSLDVARRFAHERRWWALADAIFTISIEEAWWLQLHGIAAEWLPYHPVPARERQLLAIRRERNPDPAVGWLWLADFRNVANQVGAGLTLEWLNHNAGSRQPIQIAGRGIGWLERNCADRLPANARLLGELSDHQLDHLYRTCTAQLIVHPATSGMLTRVVDAAVAGIPLVGNSMATKSYASCFASGAEVIPLLRSTAAERGFAEQLLR